MPLISSFYGILIFMYFVDNKQHKLPHVHVEYSGKESIFNINDASLLEEDLQFSPEVNQVVAG